MFVCICHAVTDTTIERLIDEGACSVDALTRACKAGGDCGACRSTMEDMLDAAHDARRLPMLPAAGRAGQVVPTRA
jgi:bacterioferritin-associated ferredoxin